MIGSSDIDHVFILGGEKCGSTWLQHLFDTNPQFCLYPEDQETHFFTRHYDKGIPYYHKMFAHKKPGQITVDADPAYFSKPDILERIRKYVSEEGIRVRFILSVREPLSRIESAYKMILRRQGFKDLTDEMKTGSYISNSSYYTHLNRYLECFDREEFCLVLYDDILEDSDKVVRQVEAFLGYTPNALSNVYKGTRVNSAGLRRSKHLTNFIKQGSSLVRNLNSPALLHAIKRNPMIARVQNFNSVAYSLSDDEKRVLESYREQFVSEVEGISRLMNRPEIVEKWGYQNSEN